MNLNEITTWTDEELATASNILDREKSRRYTLKSAERQMNNLMWEYSAAVGRKSGDSWTQPVGAHDSYPEGIVVSHAGKEWRSLIPGNVWEPGVSGWREEVDSANGEVPEYLPPTGAHDAYRAGDIVSFQGKTYRSLIDSNVYSPAEYPTGWEEITLDDEPVDSIPVFVQPTGSHDAYNSGDRVSFDGSVFESLIDSNVYSPSDSPESWALIFEGTPEPEPEPEPEVPEEGPQEWVAPTGAHDAYNTGDQVLFEGAVYESVIDGNSYSPSDYPAGWTLVREEATPEPEPEPEPEVPAEETVPEFVQPTGAHDSYSIGDRVTFEGTVYESTIDNNSYSPSAYPAGWTAV